MMWTVTKASRSSSRDTWWRSRTLPSLGVGVMEKRLVDVGSMWWMRK